MPGSHKLGRIDHVKVGGQMTADKTRLGHVLDKLKVEYAEMNAGELPNHCCLVKMISYLFHRP